MRNLEAYRRCHRRKLEARRVSPSKRRGHQLQHSHAANKIAVSLCCQHWQTAQARKNKKHNARTMSCKKESQARTYIQQISPPRSAKSFVDNLLQRNLCQVLSRKSESQGKFQLSMPMPCSSAMTFQNFAPIWTSPDF